MSENDTKELTIEVKDLSIEKEQHVDDLLRFLEEQLPQIEISRSGNDVGVIMPHEMSKRVIKLRIKKFLHQKNLTEKFRPISYKTSDNQGYMIKEKRTLELTYY
ncbi:MAG: 60S ribosomal protein L22 [Candidatus Lokiarchaeota archaeon]|nr:60S ribosomal protein L22 [Candidatus Lokiarchaeota archaeon]